MSVEIPRQQERPSGAGSPRARHVMLYVPGLGHDPANTAERVAELLARQLDRDHAGSFRAEDTKATAPRGLRAAKTVVDADGSPLYEVFELDYRHRLEDLDPVTGSAARPPSFFQLVGLSVKALIRFRRALSSPAKTGKAKAQLVLGLAVVLSLAVLTAVSLGALLVATGVVDRAPSWLGGLEDATTATAAAAGSGLTAAGAWTAFRPGLLRFATQVSHLMRYLEEDRHRSTVTLTLDDALDGLRDAGWPSGVTVLAYSFGSVVAVDALHGREDLGGRALGTEVRQLVTVGWPADAVRLYYPDHYGNRTPRVPDLPWVNVFIPADVFGSNFADGDDVGERSVRSTGLALSPTSRRYTNQQLSPLGVLAMRGFRTHGGYWGRPDEGSCFALLTDVFPVDVPEAPSRKKSRAGVRRA